MVRPKAIVLSGYGLNCEEETKFAFEKAYVEADIVHINNLASRLKSLADYQIMAVPGGFSYGDDTGSGNAFANRMKNHLWDDIEAFVESDTLTIGICNGFQILVNLGLLPALDGKYGERQVALVHNDSARYNTRWVDLRFQSKSPWTRGVGEISLPVAHGEGKWVANPETLGAINYKGLVAARYFAGDICSYQDLPASPNGSLENIAALQDETGRVLGMMPHPERAIEFTHLPNWPLLKESYKRRGQPLPQEGPGLQIFRNAREYFR